MRKIILDFSVPDNKKKVHEYIAKQMDFPDYYGKNLDSLYDELTSIKEPTAVGIFLPIGDLMDLDIDLMVYFDQIGEVFTDAEKSNPNLAVIFGDLSANPGYENEFEDEIDSYLEEDTDSKETDVPGDKDVLVLDIGR